MTGRQEYDRTKDRQRTLDKYMINSDLMGRGAPPSLACWAYVGRVHLVVAHKYNSAQLARLHKQLSSRTVYGKNML
jgi:hypothetical protein